MFNREFQLPSLTSAISFLVVAASAWLVLGMLQPHLIFTNTLPAGGDMGAHVLGPWFMKNFLLEHGRITGWSPAWYTGFPAFTFYFPFPALLIAILNFILPYGIAFKIVAVSGVVTMPVSAWAFGKLAKVPFPVPACLAAGALVYVFDMGYTIFGGNIMSTLAGEYSFSIALSLTFVFLGLVAGGLETGRHRAWAAVLLALIVLSHILPTLFALLGGAILLLIRAVQGEAKLPAILKWAIPVAVAGCFITGFWSIPFIANHNYMNDMGWEKMGTGQPSGTKIHDQNIKTYTDALLVNETKVRVATVGAVLGVVTSMIFRRRIGLMLVVVCVILVLAFVYMPQGRLWNARILPFYYLTIYLLAAMFIAEIGLGIATKMRGTEVGDDVGDGLELAAPLMALAIAFAMIIPHLPMPGWWKLGDALWLDNKAAKVNQASSWAKWNFEGYDGKTKEGVYAKSGYTEFVSVVNMMTEVGKTRGCGRVMWEFESELNRFGTTMALQLLPMYTNGCMGSMEGLFFESSATVPYHFLTASELSKAPSNPMRNMPYRGLNVADGVTKLQLMGAKYYLALSPEAIAQAEREPRLTKLASVPAAPAEGAPQREWVAYEVANVSVVTPLVNQPNVLTKPSSIPDRRNPKDVGNTLSPREAWLENQLRWWSAPENYDTPLAQSGPKDWPRIKNASEPLKVDPIQASITISDVKTTDDRIAFRVDQTNVPVIVHTSYFPNWEAKGARGPYRISPNQMVVIPTKHEVQLHYGRTMWDWLGIVMTIVGLVSLYWLRRPVAELVLANTRREHALKDELSASNATADGASNATSNTASDAASNDESSPDDAMTNPAPPASVEDSVTGSAAENTENIVDDSTVVKDNDDPKPG